MTNTPDIPYVYTLPAQPVANQQPTVGRIAAGVFFGNLCTGLLGGFIWLIAYLAG